MRTKLGLLKKAASTFKKAANSKVVKQAGRTLRKQYQDHKGLLRTIDKKIPEYAEHAINAGVLGQVVGTASANPMLVAGSAGLFGAGVVTKAAHQGIHAGVDLYHKIRKKQVQPRDVVKAGQQLSNSVRSTEKVLFPDKVQYA